MTPPTTRFGRTLLIANPAARSGRGAAGADVLEQLLRSQQRDLGISELAVYRTQAPGDATAAARAAAGFETVAVLGGDGIIHEAVNGMMAISRSERPRLAVIPMGSGNDYARTLSIRRNRPAQALMQLAQGETVALDLGVVNGIYFAQTLSFGLDAAIALKTMELRAETSHRGSRLFALAGIDVFTRGTREPFTYRATVERPDGSTETFPGACLVFAVQVGPTYGGGFRICPQASPRDGLLDLCRSVTVPPIPRTLGLFALARLGCHTWSNAVQLARFARLTVDFDREPPCQADGEALAGTHFDIAAVPGALDVAVPRASRLPQTRRR